MEVTLAGDSGTKATIQPFDFRNQLPQSQVITLIQRHQADEAIWPDDCLWYELGIKQHAVNIAR
jgi:hypothetical protein